MVALSVGYFVVVGGSGDLRVWVFAGGDARSKCERGGGKINVRDRVLRKILPAASRINSKK